MTETPVRRFSAFHRVLHWMIAIPYIALLISGAILILIRLDRLTATSAPLMSRLHRWVGSAFTVIVLQMVFSAFVGGAWRTVGRDVLIWIRQSPRDVWWLLLVPLNAIAPRWFRLPAAGRFNAGQKLHGLFVLVAVVGFIVTGVTMILIPGWITVWQIHVGLFIGAVGFLGLHLFLSLVNPPTRAALGGIFTGWVSRKYAESHHPLELESMPRKSEPHAIVSLPALVGAAGALCVALYFGWTVSNQKPLQETIDGPWQSTILMPGPLVASHANRIMPSDCVACHTDGGPVTDTSCIKCHEQIDANRLARRGFHANLAGACASCHVEHRGANADLRSFDAQAFNHDLASFKLEGAHRLADCKECHLRHSPSAGEMHYIGIKSTLCTDCHNTVHSDLPAAVDCLRCHSQQGWTGQNLTFDHNRDSSFRIDSLHEGISCRSCHTSVSAQALPVFRGTARSCVDCHQNETDGMAGRIGGQTLPADPHNGRVSCVECHKTDLRAPSAAQFAQRCVDCHNSAYRALYFDWQRSLCQHEQEARLRIAATPRDADQTRALNGLIEAARVTGIHNPEAATDLFRTIGQ